MPERSRPRPDPTDPGRADGVTASFSGLDTFAAYRRLYAAGADVEALGQDFHASVATRLAGSLVISERTLHDVAHSRDAERVRRDAFDHVTLGFVHAGELELQTQRRQTIRAGNVVFLDMTRPALHRARARMTTVSAPRALVPRGVDAQGLLHGLCLGAGAASPLAYWLKSQSFGPDAEATLADALAAAFSPANDLAAIPDSSRRRQDRARELIEAELSNPDHSSERLARQLGMSRATLYRVFGPLGSVQRWRQSRRLLRLKASMAFTDASVAKAAEAVGLGGAAHASALFSRAFGVSPTQFRRSMSGIGTEVDNVQDLGLIFDNIPVFMLRGEARRVRGRG